jgi:hypothetical protein
MSLLNFCPTQTKQPLDQLPPRRWRIQWISKRWLPSKTTARKCSACWAAHPSNWLFARQAPDAWLETFPQAIFAQFSPKNSEKPFLIIFTMLLTLGGSLPVVLFHLGLCGAVYPATSPPGPAGVWPASRARSTATHTWSPNPSPSPNGIFLTFMLI